jgi:hypothetical protein
LKALTFAGTKDAAKAASPAASLRLVRPADSGTGAAAVEAAGAVVALARRLALRLVGSARGLVARPAALSLPLAVVVFAIAAPAPVGAPFAAAVAANGALAAFADTLGCDNATGRPD